MTDQPLEHDVGEQSLEDEELVEETVEEPEAEESARLICNAAKRRTTRIYASRPTSTTTASGWPASRPS